MNFVIEESGQGDFLIFLKMNVHVERNWRLPGCWDIFISGNHQIFSPLIRNHYGNSSHCSDCPPQLLCLWRDFLAHNPGLGAGWGKPRDLRLSLGPEEACSLDNEIRLTNEEQLTQCETVRGVALHTFYTALKVWHSLQATFGSHSGLLS